MQAELIYGPDGKLWGFRLKGRMQEEKYALQRVWQDGVKVANWDPKGILEVHIREPQGTASNNAND